MQTSFDPNQNRKFRGWNKIVQEINFCYILLPYQEHCIAKHEFSIFPEITEQHIIRQVDDRTITDILGSE